MDVFMTQLCHLSDKMSPIGLIFMDHPSIKVGQKESFFIQI